MPQRTESFKILDSVISLTQERDVRALQQGLVEALSSFTNADSAILIKQDPSNEDGLYKEISAVPEGVSDQLLDFQELEWGERLVRADHSIAECVSLGHPLREEYGSGFRYLYPIKRRDIFAGVLLIYCARLSRSEQVLIHRLLAIYHNYSRVLDENERDTLTGLLNRKTFDGRISEIISDYDATSNLDKGNGHERRHHESDEHHWLGVLDIDHFKRVNDSFGHLFGDEVLLLFAGLMRKCFRGSDLLFRYGGEEFVAVLSPTTAQEALSVFERFRQTVESHEFAQVGRITVSIGVARITAEDFPSKVVSQADQALYYAKEHGRNQVCSYRRLIEKGELEALQAEGDIELF